MEKFIQQVESKRGCSKFYSGEFLENLKQEQKYVTWKDFDPRMDVDYSWLKLQNRPISAVCPPEMQRKYSDAKNTMLAHYRALRESKMDLDNNCFYDLVPSFHLEAWFAVLNDISRHIWREVDIPDLLYDTLRRAHVFSLYSSEYEISFDSRWLGENGHSKTIRDFNKLTKRSRVLYDIFGTKTGRFTTKPSSFPILTINKELRRAIVPKNDVFAVFDYNAAEARVMLALLGESQPQQDLHEYHSALTSLPREECKKVFFSWLYDYKKTHAVFDSLYDRSALEKSHYVAGSIKTPYGREISVTREKAVNYLIQSTTSDLVVENFHKVATFLKDKKTLTCFAIHDSLVLDVASSEVQLLKEVLNMLQNTKYGTMPCSFQLGDNLRNLRSLQ